MVEKRISIYGDLDVLSPFNSDQLFFEISETHAALIVKSGLKNELNALEYFEFDKLKQDWYEIFYQIRMHSKILDRSYNDTKVFYHLKEVVIVPAALYNADTSDIYLSTLFGDVENSVTNRDEVFSTLELYLPYKISKPLFDMVNTNLMMVSSKHSYSKIAEQLFRANKGAGGYFLKVIFYHNMITVALMNHNKLQLIQSYSFETPDDLLYLLLNLLQQFGITASELQIEVSGMLDVKSKNMEYLNKLFPKIVFDIYVEDAGFKNFCKEYPIHYFTPFLNNLS
jgi:hypothetical protein